MDESGNHINGNWGYCSEKCIENEEILKCKTTYDSPSKTRNVACVFPFIHDNTTFNSCTDVTDPDGRFWCSSKVDESGKHIQGNWGFCSEDCFDSDNDEDEEEICRTTNESGSRVKNEKCIFPFILFGKIYHACTDAKDSDGRFWCSTEVDESGQHVRKKWGYCSSNCKLTNDEAYERYLHINFYIYLYVTK